MFSIFLLLMSFSSSAHAASPQAISLAHPTAAVRPLERTMGMPHERSDFWSRVESLVNRCAVEPYFVDAPTGRRHSYWLESQCPDELEILGDGQARFWLDGIRYHVVMSESEDSDGGDLFHFSVLDDQGQAVAYRKQVASFGDILLGLAGGHFQGARKEVSEP
jgi:hypothetical protein